MLVVKVEMWPGGSSDRATEISRIGLANISKPTEFSNYEMTALLARDTTEEFVLRGEINQHERALGWVPLARRALTEIHLGMDAHRVDPYDDPVAELLRKGSRG